MNILITGRHQISADHNSAPTEVCVAGQ